MAKPRINGKQPPVVADPRQCRIFVCGLYDETIAAYAGNDLVMAKLKEFIRDKRTNPMGRFGNKDRLFNGEGNLAGYVHAGLTGDVSVVYKLSGNAPRTLVIYGIFSHDELGIGQPDNVKRQKANRKRMDGQAIRPLSPLDETTR